MGYYSVKRVVMHRRCCRLSKPQRAPSASSAVFRDQLSTAEGAEDQESSSPETLKLSDSLPDRTNQRGYF